MHCQEVLTQLHSVSGGRNRAAAGVSPSTPPTEVLLDDFHPLHYMVIIRTPAPPGRGGASATPPASTAKCPKCSVAVTTKGVKCDSCEKWCHPGCYGIDGNLYKAFEIVEGLWWTCTSCKTDTLLDGSREIKLLRERMDHMQEVLIKNQADNTAAITKLTETVDKLLNSAQNPVVQTDDLATHS